jgi:branched-chain amino acid transport system ATP-binding protein
VSLLAVDNVSVQFGGLVALDGVGFEVGSAEIVGLIGPNGAGKTTLFNVITGIQRPIGGIVRVNGREVTGLEPHRIAAEGVVRTFQGADVFEDMTVQDSLRVACHLHGRPTILRSLIGGRALRRMERAADERVEEVMALVGVADLRHHRCRELPEGQRRLVSVAVALASRPRLLMLDEPLAGLAEDEVAAMLALCRIVRGQGASILLVEHNLEAVMGVCDRVLVLNFGEKIADGAPDEIRRSDAVIKAYLGDAPAREVA